ncbi:MAG: SGNH/GDSL hydrolase family protein [Thermoanaerobaculia bacterium]
MKRSRVLPLAAAMILVAAGVFAAPTFSNYVAIGDSLTAGWQSGCLVARHQLRSYPATLAARFGMTVAGEGDSDPSPGKFQQPLAGEPGIPQPCYSLTLSAAGVGIDFHAGEPGGQPENSTLPRPYNNLGIPGSHSYDQVDKTTSSGADIYSLVLRNFPGSPLNGTSAVEQAIALQPTFITVWAGNNDDLDAVGSGTVISDSCLALNPAENGLCDGITLTTIDKFTTKYTQILQTLHAALPNATIVVVTLPDVTSIPFATTVPAVVINPATQQPVLDPSGHVIPLIGEKHDGTVAQVDPSTTLVTLGALPLEAQGLGIPCAVAPNLPACDHPLPDGHLELDGLHPGVLLYGDEVAAVLARNAAYNAAITTAAASIGAPVFDINAIFHDIRAHGKTYGGVTLTTTFLTGGIFGYDGVHPNNVGYAIVADEMIKFLNSTYGTKLARVDVYGAMFQPDVPSSGDSLRPSSATSGASLFPIEAWQRLLDVFAPVHEAVRTVPLRELFPGASRAGEKEKPRF